MLEGKFEKLEWDCTFALKQKKRFLFNEIILLTKLNQEQE